MCCQCILAACLICFDVDVGVMTVSFMQRYQQHQQHIRTTSAVHVQQHFKHCQLGLHQSKKTCKRSGACAVPQVQASCEQAMRLWWEDFHPGWMIFTLGNQHFDTLNQIIQYSQSSAIKGALGPMKEGGYERGDTSLPTGTVTCRLCYCLGLMMPVPACCLGFGAWGLEA